MKGISSEVKKRIAVKDLIEQMRAELAEEREEAKKQVKKIKKLNKGDAYKKVLIKIFDEKSVIDKRKKRVK